MRGSLGLEHPDVVSCDEDLMEMRKLAWGGEDAVVVDLRPLGIS
jgi:hypothetical protein